MIQDEPDDEFILRGDFNAGISLLKQHSLVYDILIFARHLRAAISFVDRHPTQIFVLDHAAKPEYSRARTGTVAFRFANAGATGKCLLQAVGIGDGS